MKKILSSFSFVLKCLGGFVLCLPYTWGLMGTECCLVLSPLPLSTEPWHSEERVGGLEESGGRAWSSRAGVACTWRRELLRAHLVALSCLFHHPTSQPKGATVRTQKRPSSLETRILERQPWVSTWGQGRGSANAGASFPCKDLSTVGLAFGSVELPLAKKMKAGGQRQPCFFFRVSQRMERARIRKQWHAKKSVQWQVMGGCPARGSVLYLLSNTSGALMTSRC